MWSRVGLLAVLVLISAVGACTNNRAGGPVHAGESPEAVIARQAERIAEQEK